MNDIHAFPGLGTIIEENCRRRRLKRFPYGVVFRVHENEIFVLAVMHLHRKPGYWKDRIKDIE